MTALQDILGEHHDAVVAIERLRDLAAAGDDRLAPPTAFAMGEIAERYRRRAAELEPEARAAYKRIAGKPWKSLQGTVRGAAVSKRRPTAQPGREFRAARAPGLAQRRLGRPNLLVEVGDGFLDALVDPVLADLLSEPVAVELVADVVPDLRKDEDHAALLELVGELAAASYRR